jgi:hypothetical protein
MVEVYEGHTANIKHVKNIIFPRYFLQSYPHKENRGIINITSSFLYVLVLAILFCKVRLSSVLAGSFCSDTVLQKELPEICLFLEDVNKKV